MSYLFWAYNVVWIGIVALVWLTWSRVRRTERRLDRLEGAGD